MATGEITFWIGVSVNSTVPLLVLTVTPFSPSFIVAAVNLSLALIASFALGNSSTLIFTV